MSGPKFMAPHAIVEVFYSKPKNMVGLLLVLKLKTEDH